MFQKAVVFELIVSSHRKRMSTDQFKKVGSVVEGADE